jgi:AbrB family looped-hinge helix DNA binding protein
MAFYIAIYHLQWYYFIMAKTTIPIDRAGRVVLPKPVRDHFRLRGGDRLIVQERGEAIELRPLQPAVKLKKISGVLVVADDTAALRGVDLVAESRRQRLDDIAAVGSKDPR